MAGRKDRHVGLVFQWDATAWEDAPLWLDALSARLGDRPVHWNLTAIGPGLPPRRRAAIARALKERIAAAGDAVTCRGYAGACHPLLGLDDLDREVAWGVHNPWGTGIADVLDVKPSMLLPSLPDLARPGALDVYGSHGFASIGACINRAGGIPPAARGFVPVACIRLATERPGSAEARWARRLAASGGGVLLLVDLTGQTTESRLEAAFRDLVEPVLQAGAAVPYPAGPLESPAPRWRLDWTAYPAPRLHGMVTATAAVARRRRRRSEDTQALLAGLAPGAPEGPRADPEAGDGAAAKSRLVAHMLGDVVLAGPSFDVRLAAGRFSGLVRGNRDIMPVVPARSWVRAGGRVLPFHTRSSFSFEEDAGSGLREHLDLGGGVAASLDVEYAFRGDAEELSISARLLLPALAAPMEEYAPLEIAARCPGRSEAVTVRAEGPDGSASEVPVPADGSPVAVPGAVHRLPADSGGTIVLRWTGGAAGAWGVPSFRVARVGRARVLLANLFGGTAAAAGLRESHAVLVGVDGT